MRISLLTFLFICATVASSIAQDRYFGFASQSNVIPKNTRQVEVWYANKSGSNTYFNGNYSRIGLKMGLGKNVLTEFFINVNNESYIENYISRKDQKTRIYGKELINKNTVAFANELKIKLSDPVANPIGCAIYNELTIGTTFFDINPKLILDKRVGQNFWTFNFNVLIHNERELDTTAVVGNNPPKIIKTQEIPFEFQFGYMHFSKNNKMGIGFEVRNHNEILESVGWEHSALFIGPALHFRDENWFFNITALPQIGNLKKTWIAPDSHVWDEHQKFELRTVLGFIF